MADKKKPVYCGQGTRLSSTPPWETYGKSLDIKMNKTLAAEVETYSRSRHKETSAQNQEELAYQKELSAQAAKPYQFIDPAEYRDTRPRIGKIMHSSTIINKLREAGVQCWYADHMQGDKLTLMVKTRPGLPIEVGCWVGRGFTTEYEIIRFDERDVVLDSKFRGWRTVLLQLILKGVITEEKAHEIFGRPTSGAVSTRYRMILQNFRNRNSNEWKRTA